MALQKQPQTLLTEKQFRFYSCQKKYFRTLTVPVGMAELKGSCANEWMN